MSRSLFGPRYIPVKINKFIPTMYLLMESLLINRSFVCMDITNIILYSEKGVIKQLKLFKKLSNKLLYINIDKNEAFLTINKNKNLLLYNIFLRDDENFNMIEMILIGYHKNEIYKIYLYKYLQKKIYKKEPEINIKELYEWKEKQMTVKERNIFNKDFNKIYNTSLQSIKDNINNPKLVPFFKKYEKKLKVYEFDKELKAIQNSIFYTCKVKTLLHKLFPKFK